MHRRKWLREISSLYGLHGGKEKKKCSNPIPPTITWWSSVIGYLIATQLDSLQQKKPSLPLLMDSHELYLKIYDWWCNRDNMIKSRNQWRFWNAIISSGCTKPQNWVWLLRGSLLHSLWLRIKLSAQQITEPHWVEGLLVRDASEITSIYLPDMPYVNPFQLSEVNCELGTTWKKTEGHCARFQKNLKDHKAGPGWRQAHHKRLHQTILPITTWWPFWWSWWGGNMIWSRTLWVPST